MDTQTRESWEAGRKALEVAASATDAEQLGAQLFEISNLLSDNPPLLRALTEMGRSNEDRLALARNLFEGHCSPEALDVVRTLVPRRWKQPRVLPEVLGNLGVEAYLRSAMDRAHLRTVQSELFSVSTLLGNDRELRVALSQLSGRPLESRLTLISQILDGRVLPITEALVKRAVRISRHGRLMQTLRRFEKMGAQLAGTRLVTVTVAAPLTGARRERMKALIEKQLGVPVTLAVTVDPGLIGGFQVNYGAEAIDASIASELSDAKRVLTQ